MRLLAVKLNARLIDPALDQHEAGGSSDCQRSYWRWLVSYRVPRVTVCISASKAASWPGLDMSKQLQGHEQKEA